MQKEKRNFWLWNSRSIYGSLRVSPSNQKCKEFIYSLSTDKLFFPPSILFLRSRLTSCWLLGNWYFQLWTRVLFTNGPLEIGVQLNQRDLARERATVLEQRTGKFENFIPRYSRARDHGLIYSALRTNLEGQRKKPKELDLHFDLSFDERNVRTPSRGNLLSFVLSVASSDESSLFLKLCHSGESLFNVVPLKSKEEDRESKFLLINRVAKSPTQYMKSILYT